MRLMTLIREPIVNDSQGMMLASAVTLLALGCILLGLF